MSIQNMPYNLTEPQIVDLWDRCGRGETVSVLARRFGKGGASLSQRVRSAGGIRPVIPVRASRHLRLEDREEISRGLAAGESMRQIAIRLHRSPSTSSREIAVNGGCLTYRASRADRAAVLRRQRPKVPKLASCPQLRRLVAAKLKLKWSPEQIAGWLKRTYPGDAELQVSHETIYRTLYIQSRGALKRQLTAHLRTRRQTRRPGHRNRDRGDGRGQLVGMVNISERPPDVADRAIPGHWEGDLILGKGMSAIGALV